MKNKLSILILIGSCFLYSADVTVWISNINLDQNRVEVSVSNSVPIAGFQFTVSPADPQSNIVMNATPTEGELAVGGIASQMGFTIHRNESGMLLGYSLDVDSGLMQVIPVTEEGASQVLLYTEYTGTAATVDDFSLMLLPDLEDGSPGHSFCDEDANVLTSVIFGEELSNNQGFVVSEFRLGEAYPNPFNPETVIEYDVSINQGVNITVYDMMGRNIKELVNSHHSSGRYSVIWDGTNSMGDAVSSGMYLYKMTSGEFNRSNKMLLLK
tara:strand:- start:554 stop:1360 length:807 start_codon:yes stop_codon:yes gene_type:complete